MDDSAGPDDWSAWPFASITVSRSNRRGHMHGLPGLSKGSHHFVGALDLSFALRRKFLLPSPSRPSGRDRPVVVLAAAGHQHEDNARDLVGDRHCGEGGELAPAGEG